MRDADFAPNDLAIALDSNVTATLSNRRPKVHHLTIAALSARSNDMQSGATVSLTVSDKVGD